MQRLREAEARTRCINCLRMYSTLQLTLHAINSTKQIMKDIEWTLQFVQWVHFYILLFNFRRLQNNYNIYRNVSFCVV